MATEAGVCTGGRTKPEAGKPVGKRVSKKNFLSLNYGCIQISQKWHHHSDWIHPNWDG